MVLYMFSQQRFDLVALTQFGYLLKFVNDQVALPGVIGQKTVKPLKRLFEQRNADFLACRLHGNGNAAIRLGGKVRAPVGDQTDRFFQQFVILVDEPEDVSSQNPGDVISTCDSGHIYRKRDKPLEFKLVLYSLDQRGLSISARGVQHYVGICLRMATKRLQLFRSAAECSIDRKDIKVKGVCLHGGGVACDSIIEI